MPTRTQATVAIALRPIMAAPSRLIKEGYNSLASARRGATAPRSLHRNLGVRDHLAPEGGLLGKEMRGLRSSRADRLHLHLVEAVAHLAPAEDLGDVAIDALGERVGRAGWRHDAEPGDRAVARIELGDR